MKFPTTAALLTTIVGLAVFASPLPRAVHAQGAGAAAPAAAPTDGPKKLTGAEDHQRVMDLLKITKIRPGGQSSAVPDESKANPYPDLPDPLVTNDGRKVTTADMWWKVRRPEIVEMFDREVYGRVPKVTPKVTWEVTSTVEGMNGTFPIITKTLVGHVDNSSYPAITVNLQASLTLPANAMGPSPVMLIFGAGGGGGGPRGGRGGAGRGGAPGAPGAPGAAPAGPGAMGDDEFPEFFVAAPAGPAVPGAAAPAAPGAGDAPAAPGGRRGGRGRRGGGAGAPGAAGAPDAAAAGGGRRGGGAAGGGTPWQQTALSKGWGYASINTSSVQADNGNGLQEGIIGLCNKGEPRKLDDWGALRAWTWGASRVMDYFETDKGVDAKQIGLEGHSRWGKATALGMAYDDRFAICYVSSSGEGGVKLHRRNFGELVENVAGTGEYHWMAGNFIKYGADPLKWSDMPVDSHELVALCAPRPVFVSGGATQGDGWVDAKGMFMAAAAAQPVYALLGKKTMGTNEFPPMETPLIDGEIAFRQHSGGHTDVPNWPTFFTFADRYIHGPKLKPTAAAN